MSISQVVMRNSFEQQSLSVVNSSVAALPIGAVAEKALLFREKASQNSWYSLHWSTHLTICGSLGLLVKVIIAAVASNWSLAVSETFLFIASAIGAYYTYNSSLLKTLDEYNNDLAGINQALDQKNRDIKDLTVKLNQSNQEFVAQQVKYNQVLKSNNEVEANLQAQLAKIQDDFQKTTVQLGLVQEQAALDLAKKVILYQNAEKKFQQVIDIDANQINQLNQVAQSAKDELINLQTQQKIIKGQLVEYQQTNAKYAIENDRLQKEITDLHKMLTEQAESASSIGDNQIKLQTLIAKHSETSTKMEQSAAQFNSLMGDVAALNERLSRITNKLPATFVVKE